jgi:hypothetical protein
VSLSISVESADGRCVEWGFLDDGDTGYCGSCRLTRSCVCVIVIMADWNCYPDDVYIIISCMWADPKLPKPLH